MKIGAKKEFSKHRASLEKKVESFESKTGCDLKIVITKRASQYKYAAWRMATFFLLIYIVILYFESFDAHYTILQTVLVSIGILVASFFLVRLNLILDIFVTENEKLIKSKVSSLIWFQRLKIYETSHRSGVLLLISLFEHRIDLVCDKNANQVYSQEHLDEMISMLKLRFKKGDFVGGVESIICELEKKFLLVRQPFDHKSRSEISNHILLVDAND